jgi:hypothetical protein
MQWRRGSGRGGAHVFSAERGCLTRKHVARPHGPGLILTRLWLATRCGWDSRAPGRRLLCALPEFHCAAPKSRDNGGASERSSACLERVVWVHEVAGSNPVAPTILFFWRFYIFQFFSSFQGAWVRKLFTFSAWLKVSPLRKRKQAGLRPALSKKIHCA